ncbi:MAG: AAA family ATPase [Candidatus Magnetoovum sp. WYHC-5]|nr:AAA family ATPase [Candidatus Magnetoovum sp. WYHC-5]
MKIKSISTINFRNLKNTQYDFVSNGLTCVFGPNEAGKSSILEAIEEVFFTKVEKAVNPNFQTWDGERPVIKLTIELEQANNVMQDVIVERNFQDNKSYIRGATIDLKNEKQIKGFIGELFGFFDIDTFRTLLTVKQKELSSLKKTTIEREVEALVTASRQGMSVYELIRFIDDILTVKRTAFKGQDGAFYNNIISDIQKLKDKKTELTIRLEAFSNKANQLLTLKKDIETSVKQISLLDTQTKWLQIYIKVRKLNDKLKQLSKINAKIEYLSSELEILENEQRHQGEKLKNYIALKEINTSILLNKKDIDSYEKTNKRLSEIKDRIAAIDVELTDKIIPKLAEIDTLKTLIARYNELNDTLKSQALNVEVEAFKEIEINTTEKNIFLKPSKKASLLFIGHKNSFLVPGILNVSLNNIGLTNISLSAETCEKEIEEFGKKFTTKNPQHLEHYYTLHMEKVRLKVDEDKLLSSITQKEFKERLDEKIKEHHLLQLKAEELLLKLGNIKEFEIEEAIYEMKKVELENKKGQLAQFRYEKASLIGQTTEENIEKEKVQIEHELSRFDIDNDFVRTCLPLQINELKENLKNLLDTLSREKQNRQRFDVEAARLGAELANVPSYEELSVVSEELEALEVKKNKADDYLKSLIILEETLKEAAKKTVSIINEKIDNCTSKYFNMITLNKYENVKVSFDSKDSIKLLVKEFTKDKYREVLTNIKTLSSGATEQLYFSLRIALIEILCGKKNLPFLLDDPFVDYDNKRLQETAALIKNLGIQCILFTCHENIVNSFKDFAKVINL